MTVLLAFNTSNQLAVRRAGTKLGNTFVGADPEMALGRLETGFVQHTGPKEFFGFTFDQKYYRIFFAQVNSPVLDQEVEFHTLEQLDLIKSSLAPLLSAVLAELPPYLIEIPYLHLGENDYIYRFRVEKDRNRNIYQQDHDARDLYQSRLCDAIKALARTNERSASKPATLDFGAVQYVIPSHFGFCLGVKNAIERAYESLAENPGRRVFMLSELIHNSFVNEDLLRRGLRFLQTDKGQPFTVHGTLARHGANEPLLWDEL
ncbi:MAG TPA: 4-hydroxy-3-methylbut-2-enyl diphosphate reductase, partial [Lacunisphaera sp.]